MTSTKLIESFMTKAKWGQNASDGRPYRGEKWLTVKQKHFLWSLSKKEDPNGIDFFSKFTWVVNGYKAEMTQTAPNGCVCMNFTNTIAK